MKLFGVQKLNSQTSDILRKLMTFIVGLIQGMGIAINLVLDNGISLFGSKGWIAILSVAFLLAVGGFLIYWFATMNMEKGIGGSIILIFISMLMSWPQVFNDLFLTDLKNDPSLTNIILAGTVILALILFIGFFVQFYQAEVRLPFVHIMSDDENSKSYFPLRLMAGGGMSFMYAMSFMTIPQYIIPIIRYVFPNATTVPYVLSQISISNTYGIVLYIAIVFLLSFIFAFINVNPEDIAENYQKSGDYFVGVKPGLPTQKFLVKHLIRLATIGAIFFSILSGLPMLLGVFNPTLREFGVIPGQLMFVVILSLTLTDQIKGGSEKYMYPDLLKI
jgi:preprotein translocase subunit SecY